MPVLTTKEITTPSRVYKALRQLGGSPDPALGQNFLLEGSLLRAMVEDLRIEKEDTVLEIGPGLGHLTQHLLTRAGRVIAVEIDKRLAESLTERLGDPGGLKVLDRDILDLTPEEVTAESSTKQFVLTGNLPYYCSSPILIRVFERWFPYWNRAGFLLQEEVTDRLVAAPGRKTYGRLSVLVQTYSEARKIRKIPPHLFVPEPEVTSSWCLLNRKKDTEKVNVKTLSRLTGWCFAQRRKTLLNNLARELGKPKAAAVLVSAEIDGCRRAETLSIEEFSRLASCLLDCNR